MRLSKNKIKLFAGLVLLLAVFLYLRLKNLNHLLMWDEAWNILSLRAFLLNAVKDPFYWFYRYHPPLYMTFARLLFPFEAGFDIRLQYLSLFFASLLFLVTYFLSARIGGFRYAWLSGLFLCVMPASIGYDTWIKRDGLTSVWGYLALLLLFKRKYLWCGALLALSLLTKENGLFFLLSAVLLIFLFKEKKALKKILTLGLAAFILSAWWYIFFSEMTTHGMRFFSSKGEYSMVWAENSLYYFKKLLPDMGAAGLFFLVIGMIYLIWRGFRKKEPRWLVPVTVATCVYIPNSFFFTLKAPWLFLPAVPALAMIAGGGALYLFKKSRGSEYLLTSFYILLAAVVFSGLTFSYPKYNMKTYPNGWPGAMASRRLAGYLNEHMKDEDRLMITHFAYWQMPTCPVFLYYWKPHQVQIIKGNERIEDIIKYIAEKRISWLVVVGSPDPKAHPDKLVETLKNTVLEDPEKVGWSYVWNTDALWRRRK